MPSLAAVLVVGLVVVGAVAALVRTDGIGGRSDPSDPDASTDPEGFGRAAGRAANRIERAADPGNEIYRAWREMTVPLEVTDPETSTPGEFAAAAVKNGIDSEDVEELTRLFEDVRYGDRDPSAADERRAIALFRRIEAEYAEHADDTEDGG